MTSRLIALLGCAVAPLSLWVGGADGTLPQVPVETPQRFTLTPLTAHGLVGLADLSPAVSHDGRWVAYTRFERPGPEVTSELWLLDRESGREQVLVPRGRVEYWGQDFAPDGQSLYVSRSVPPFQVGELVRIRLSDGRIDVVRPNVGREPAVSPDGLSVAFNRRTLEPAGRELVVAPLEGGPERILARRASPASLNYPTWRPDGGALLVRTLDPGHATTIMEIAVADGRERVVAQPAGWGNASRSAWLSGAGAFVLTANQGSELWRVPYPEGLPERLGSVRPDSVHGLTYAPGAGLVVAVRTRSEAQLWLAGSGAAPPTERPWPHFFWHPVWTHESTLLFVRHSGPRPELVIADTEGRELRSHPLGVAAAMYPAVSSDGRVLVFNSYTVGDRSFWRTGPDGGGAVKLTPGPSDYLGGDVSPDGTWLVYSTWTSGRFSVWRMPSSGGAPTKLIGEEANLPAISPDGQWVAAYHRASTGDPWRIVVVPAAGGEAVPISDLALEGFSLGWTPDGRLSFGCAPDGVQNICVVPRTGGRVTQVTDFRQGAVGSHDWSPGGRLMVVRTRTSSDIVKIDVR